MREADCKVVFVSVDFEFQEYNRKYNFLTFSGRNNLRTNGLNLITNVTTK